MTEKMNVQLDTPFDLDTPMDQIELLPSFGAWPTGGYVCTLELEEKDIGANKALEAAFTHVETKQMGETATLSLAEPKPGDKCSCLYMLNNKVGVSNLVKELVNPINAKFGTKTSREAVKAANGAKVLVVLSREHVVKDGTGKDYMRVKAIAFI